MPRWVCADRGTTEETCPISTSTRPSVSLTEEVVQEWDLLECESQSTNSTYYYYDLHTYKRSTYYYDPPTIMIYLLLILYILIYLQKIYLYTIILYSYYDLPTDSTYYILWSIYLLLHYNILWSIEDLPTRTSDNGDSE